MYTHDTCHKYVRKYLPLSLKTQDYHVKYPNVLP